MRNNLIAGIYVLAAMAALYYFLKWMVRKANEVEATQEHEAQKPVQPDWWMNKEGKVVTQDEHETLYIGA